MPASVQSHGTAASSGWTYIHASGSRRTSRWPRQSDRSSFADLVAAPRYAYKMHSIAVRLLRGQAEFFARSRAGGRPLG